MPRPKKEQPNRSDGRHEVKATIGHDFNGDPIRKSFYSNTSKADAKQQADEYKAEMRAKALISSNPIENKFTFSKWCDLYLEQYKQPKVTEETYQQEVYRAEKYLKPYFKESLIKNIKSIDIQNFFNNKAISDKSSSVKVKVKNLLNGVFETALDNEYINKNPVRKIVLPEYKKVVEKRVYTEDELKKIFKFIENNNEFSIIGIMLKMGIRRGELLALKWTDIDFNGKILSITKSLRESSGIAKVGPPKTKAGNRQIPFDDTTKNLFENLKNDSIYFLPNSEGKYYSPKNWHNRCYTPLMNTLSSSLKISSLHPHELRHTCGTSLYNNGVDLRTIQRVMGHATLEITSGLYVHDNLDTMRRMMKLDSDSDSTDNSDDTLTTI